MARLGVDLNSGGAVPDGTYVATVKGVTFKVKSSPDGSSFNNDGTKEVDGNTFANHPTEKEETRKDFVSGELITKMFAQSKISFELATEKGNIWHDVFMSSKAMFMVKAAFDALKIPYSADDGSFDTDDVMASIGKTCLLDVSINDAGYNDVNEIKAA